MINKNFAYGIPTLNAFDKLIMQTHAVLTGSTKPDKFIVVDNSVGQLRDTNREQVESLFDAYDNFYIAMPTRNLGVAASWNYIMQSTYENTAVIIANDDILPEPNAVEELYKAAVADEFKNVYYGNAPENGNAFAFFLMPHSVYSTVGAFDENFYPAYFEDNDYKYRMDLQGINLVHVSTANYTHAGSTTIKNYTPERYQKHHEEFRANAAYYRRKWGGMPGQETFFTAYNLEI